jgi:threonine dehydrogenase-like Zn-dependent dehydrogenase
MKRGRDAAARLPNNPETGCRRDEHHRSLNGNGSQMTRMSRAVVMPGDGTWELRELPVPDPPPGGAVLRVEAVGMCHSDIDHMHGIVHTPWGGAYPSIAGHEIVGRIDALAPGTGARWGVTEGQRVAVRESVPLAGGIRVYGHDFGIDERSGLFGGFADYMELLPETLVEPLPDDIPADELTVWEPLAIAVRWATAVKPGDSVAILGPGHLGLASIVAARAAGAMRIFITGTQADALRLGAARGLGIEEAIDISAADPVERIRELTGDGADVVIDAASGSTSTVTQGMQMARRGGTVVIGGLKDRKPVDGFISDWIPMRQLHLHAGFPGDHVKTSVELIRQGQVPTAALLGETVTVDGLDDALKLLARELPGRDAIRLALRMS